jgi:hypothetical protein
MIISASMAGVYARAAPAAYHEESTMTNDNPRPARRAGRIPRTQQREAELMVEIKIVLVGRSSE